VAEIFAGQGHRRSRRVSRVLAGWEAPVSLQLFPRTRTSGNISPTLWSPVPKLRDAEATLIMGSYEQAFKYTFGMKWEEAAEKYEGESVLQLESIQSLLLLLII
jgi:hypothetical protein